MHLWNKKTNIALNNLKELLLLRSDAIPSVNDVYLDIMIGITSWRHTDKDAVTFNTLYLTGAIAFSVVQRHRRGHMCSS